MTYSDGTNSGFSRRNHYVGQPAVKVGSSNFDYYRKPEKSHGFAKRVAFFAYFPLLILWLETDLKIASGFDVLGGFAFTFLFTIVLSAVLVLLCSFSKRRGVNRGPRAAARYRARRGSHPERSLGDLLVFSAVYHALAEKCNFFAETRGVYSSLIYFS